jgi:hypothetical protein
MKTLSILESIETINYWIASVGLPVRSESYFNNWGLSESGDLLSDLKIWAFDYISEQDSIQCEK